VDPVEHSRLLYLIDALERAPGRSKELLAMAQHPAATHAYRRAVGRLRAARVAKRLLAEAARLRDDLR